MKGVMLKKMKGVMLKVLAVALPCAAAASMMVFAAGPSDPKPPADPPAAQGSESAVRRTEIKFFDEVTGREVIIFESVHEPKRYYLSPLIHLVRWDEAKKYVELPVFGGGYEYGFQVIWHHSGLEAQARKALSNEKIDTQGAISPMSLAVIGFTVPDFPEAVVKPLGETGSQLLLGRAPGVITIRVPESKNAAFKQMLDSPAGLRLDAKAYYNAMDLKRASVSWTVEDLKTTRAFKNISTGGSEFVNAESVHDMFLEIRQFAKFVDYSDDPLLTEALTKRADQTFRALLERMGEKHIRTLDEAVKLNNQVLKGAGLDPEKYQPIVLAYQFLDQTKKVTDYKEANETAKTVATENRTKLGLDVGFKPFGVPIGLNGGRAWQNMHTEMFANQKEYDDFRSEFHTKEGDGVLVVGRGLKLIEKATFENNISLAASQLALAPLHKASNFTVTQNLGRLQSLKMELHENAGLKRVDVLERQADETYRAIKDLRAKRDIRSENVVVDPQFFSKDRNGRIGLKGDDEQKFVPLNKEGLSLRTTKEGRYLVLFECCGIGVAEVGTAQLHLRLKNGEEVIAQNYLRDWCPRDGQISPAATLSWAGTLPAGDHKFTVEVKLSNGTYVTFLGDIRPKLIVIQLD